jgi:hypothetical protein
VQHLLACHSPPRRSHLPPGSWSRVVVRRPAADDASSVTATSSPEASAGCRRSWAAISGACGWEWWVSAPEPQAEVRRALRQV